MLQISLYTPVIVPLSPSVRWTIPITLGVTGVAGAHPNEAQFWDALDSSDRAVNTDRAYFDYFKLLAVSVILGRYRICTERLQSHLYNRLSVIPIVSY